MNRTVVLFVALTLVVGSVAAVPAPAAQSDGDARASAESDATTATRTNNSSSESIPPGTRLSGVVGMQGAEIDSEVESRAFGLKVAKAETDDAKAEVVANQFNQSERRADELNERLEKLKQARENGSISQGQYAARAATVQAELRSVQRMANETARVSETLPRDVRKANGVNATAIETLRRNVTKHSGPEVAAIAQNISGPQSHQRPTQVDDHPRGPAADDRTVPGNRATGNRTFTGNRTADGTRTADRTRIGNGTRTANRTRTADRIRIGNGTRTANRTRIGNGTRTANRTRIGNGTDINTSSGDPGRSNNSSVSVSIGRE